MLALVSLSCQTVSMEPTTPVPTSVRIPVDLLAHIDDLADQCGRSRNAEIVAALAAWTFEANTFTYVDEWLREMLSEGIEA